MKYKPEQQLSKDGYTRWIAPIHKGYIIVCCDCGLAHKMQFKVVKQGKTNKDGSWNILPTKFKKLRVMFRAKRENRITGQLRRQKRVRECND